MITIEQRPLTPWRTSTGVVVGGAYIRPKAEITRDGEIVQAALLKRDHEVGHRLVPWIAAACGVACVVIVLAI